MKSTHQRIGWLALALLLLLRIPYSVILTYASSDNTGWGPAGFQLGTYLLTVFLIWWERDDLPAVHIDTLAVLLIVVFGPVETLILRYWGIDTPLTFPHLAGLFIWAASVALIVSLSPFRYKLAPISGVSLVWLAAALLTGALLSALPDLDVFRHAQNISPASSVVRSTTLAFFYQIGFAAVQEEPLFRGFLWGYLHRLGWAELWVWLCQAILFMLAHLYFINALGTQFWIAVPAAALILGLFSWRSRSIAPGMLAHAAYNSAAYIILLGVLSALIHSR